MMYGAGEDENPLPETVACMQHLVAEYVGHVTSEACMVRQCEILTTLVALQYITVGNFVDI